MVRAWCHDRRVHPARLFVLCGLPGSGTSARAIQIEERFGVVRLSVDDATATFGVDVRGDAAPAQLTTWRRRLATDLLRRGTGVVVEWGTWSRRDRDELRSIARTSGARVHLEVLDAPLDVLWERVRAGDREHELGGRPVTRDDLERWSSELQRPTADELTEFDPMPPVRAGDRPGSPAYPYGTWCP